MTPRKRLLILAITLLTLASGLLNIYSVAGRGLPERVRLLRGLFPLEVVHFSRSGTLLAGFALVLASLNIHRRKRLAFWMVSAAAAASAGFHLAKGLDFEEALVSLALLAALYATRRNFTVRSRLPGWRSAFVRVGLAFAVAAGYGVAGFWYLEPRDFGMQFGWRDSLRYTLEFLALRGDPALVPRTAYARWFLDSLYLISSTALLYSLYAAFRPVLYQWRTHPHEVERARQILSRHCRSSQDFFKARPDKSFFFSRDGQSFLAYRVGAGVALVLGDPAGPPGGIPQIAADFLGFCTDNGWGVAFYQTLPDFLAVYQQLGFRKLKIGDEAIVELPRFTLEGKAGRNLRVTLNRLEREGIHTELYEPPLPDALIGELREVSNEWLQIPGRRERRFSLGFFDEAYLSSTTVFCATDASGRILAFVNLVPSCKTNEATADLMRRRTEAPNGVMDFVFVKLFLHFKERGVERFNLGMAPMAGFHQQEEASPEERAIHAFFQHLNFLFSFKGLLAYKSKFASYWEPRYLIYRNILDLPRVAMALSSVSKVEED